LPLIVLFAGIVPVAPLLTALIARRRLSAARWFIVAWCSGLLAGNLMMRAVGRSGQSTLGWGYAVAAIEGALALWALSLWQSKPVLRTTLRVSVPASLAAYVVIVLTVENTGRFSTVSAPLYSLLGLGAAVTTLVSRATEEIESLLRQDWFWISGGMALYFGSSAALTPLASLLLPMNLELLQRAWMVFSAAVIVGFVAIAVGMLCPNPQLASGVSSSPASSASASPS
jgi:hypothetical protein